MNFSCPVILVEFLEKIGDYQFLQNNMINRITGRSADLLKVSSDVCAEVVIVAYRRSCAVVAHATIAS
jgi:hypothetical protein